MRELLAKLNATMSHGLACVYCAVVATRGSTPQKAGAATLRDIASSLNARGVATARGGQWYAKSVANILERA